MAEQPDFEPHYDEDRDRRINTAVQVAVQGQQLKNLMEDVKEIKEMMKSQNDFMTNHIAHEEI